MSEVRNELQRVSLNVCLSASVCQQVYVLLLNCFALPLPSTLSRQITFETTIALVQVYGYEPSAVHEYSTSGPSHVETCIRHDSQPRTKQNHSYRQVYSNRVLDN